jgi:hypothetical protein
MNGFGSHAHQPIVQQGDRQSQADEVAQQATFQIEPMLFEVIGYLVKHMNFTIV